MINFIYVGDDLWESIMLSLFSIKTPDCDHGMIKTPDCDHGMIKTLVRDHGMIKTLDHDHGMIKTLAHLRSSKL